MLYLQEEQLFYLASVLPFSTTFQLSQGDSTLIYAPWVTFINPFSHTTNLQQVNLKTFSQKYENSINEKIIIE